MVETQRVEALLFDLGGVVIEIDWDLAFSHWAPFSRLTLDELRQRFAMDRAYQQHERGELAPAEYFSHLRQTLELRASDEDIADGWNAIFAGEIAHTVALIENAKDRLPCFAFSNSNATHASVWMAVYPRLVASFEQVFVSSDLGLRKPDQQAFVEVVEAIGATSSAVLFFDDTLENVQGALESGLQAVHVRSPADVERSLQTAGIF